MTQLGAGRGAGSTVRAYRFDDDHGEGAVADEERMDGRVCVVTGATAGIGQAAATALARQGATVVLVARSAERARRTREAVMGAAGHDRVDVVLADLAVQAQVRAAAREILDRYPAVHVLLNNAAVYTRRFETSPDGIEMQLAVSHLAPFLLTSLLLDRLRASGAARVVTMSSGAHHGARVPWDDLEMRERYSGLRQYANTKLYNLWMTRELARRVSAGEVTANAMHPGVVGTALLFGGFAPIRLLKPFLRTPEQGARTAVWLASSPRVREVTGGYWQDERPARSSAFSQDADAARRLWEISERMTGLA
ncbi:SDR family NAD(P)-dependent oxidoreductase [Longimicrobium sp.]|uniref:SDR family NAD(P)-dependent oxidoreductase n=1 Tax=Longimicrobium sp. TaxID=2029185 RepID=UPI002E2F7A3A|nr:SDR family NAD(P)-dependent oxidoreductase [Longimicrobium sp.]HEX6042710.1 SDR family NAD(P)-dependent oxidoreductase [Longimicrobium sp.]